jgi:hypothetical protein
MAGKTPLTSLRQIADAGVLFAGLGVFAPMALLERLFKFRKPEPPAPEPEPVIEPEPEAARSPRELVYREAFVTYDSGYKRKGIVLDHSEAGVRVRFPTNERLPENVILNAKSVNLHGPAKVVWQNGSEVGLTMVG